MKYFSVLIVATLFAAIESADEHTHPAPFDKAETECADEKKISLDVLTKAEAGNFAGIDNNLNCFAECLFTKVGFLKPGSEELQVEAMKKAAKEKGGDKYVAFVDTCTTKKGNNLCETTFQVYKCYNEEVNKSKEAVGAPAVVLSPVNGNPEADSSARPLPDAGPVAPAAAPAGAPAPGSAPGSAPAPAPVPSP